MKWKQQFIFEFLENAHLLQKFLLYTPNPP